MRIYDFEGKKNISGERIREARLKLRRGAGAGRGRNNGVGLDKPYRNRNAVYSRLRDTRLCPRPRRVRPLAPRNRVNPRPPRRGLFFCTFLKKLLTYCEQYDIIIDRKEVNTLSKRKKKRGNKAEPDSYLNLVTAILNLVIAILLLIEKLTE